MNKVCILILMVLIETICVAQHCDTLQFTWRGDISKGWESVEDTLYVVADSGIVLNVELYINVFVDTNGFAHAKNLNVVLISSATSFLCYYAYYYHPEYDAYEGECSEPLFCKFINSHQKEILKLYEQRVFNSQYTTQGSVPPDYYPLFIECHLHLLPSD